VVIGADVLADHAFTGSTPSASPHAVGSGRHGSGWSRILINRGDQMIDAIVDTTLDHCLG
jgi:hypothetical protein